MNQKLLTHKKEIINKRNNLYNKLDNYPEEFFWTGIESTMQINTRKIWMKYKNTQYKQKAKEYIQIINHIHRLQDELYEVNTDLGLDECYDGIPFNTFI